MGYLIEQLWMPLAVASLLGLGVGAWIWRSRVGEEEYIAPPVIPPAPPEDA